jgi:ABC-type oligopeptide transport system ATPase subunit
VLNLIRNLQAGHGFAARLISHDLAAARYVWDCIAVMLRGEIAEAAPARDFYGTPSPPIAVP